MRPGGTHLAKQHHVVVLDELLDNDPEPCDTCGRRLMLFVSYDGVRRCRPCVRAFADERGWNQLVLPKPKRRKKRGVDENQLGLLGDDG